MILEEYSVENLSDAEDGDTVSKNQKVRIKKHNVRIVIFNVLIVVLFFSFIGRAVWPMIVGGRKQQVSVSTEKLTEHLEVKELLKQRGFNTVDMPTSYWFFDEDKLMYIASGAKGSSKVEFYEYNDSETTDGVYNRISYDFNQNLEPKDRAKYERELKQGGKIFEMNIQSTYNIVAYRDNTVVYARCSEQDYDEIMKIVEEIGYK